RSSLCPSPLRRGSHPVTSTDRIKSLLPRRIGTADWNPPYVVVPFMRGIGNPPYVVQCMWVLLFALFLIGLYPLAQAWWANRRTSLFHAVTGGVGGWLGWLRALVFAERAGNRGVDPPRYLALCLTGCAGVAVLGARRPHVVAWNFVVLGLL